MTTTRPFLLSAFCLLTLAGCGSSDDSGGGGAASATPVDFPLPAGLDGGKQVKDLSDAQARQICDAGVTAARARISDATACEAGGIIAGVSFSLFPLGMGDAKSVCEKSVMECDADETWRDGCKIERPDQRMTCTATLTETQACFEKILGATAAWFQSLSEDHSCSDELSILLLAGAPQAEQLSECAGVRQKCPDLFENSGTSVNVSSH